MRRFFRFPAALFCLGLVAVAGCSRPPANQFQGYIEGEFVYVGAPLPGTLEQRPVERGQVIKTGDLLFVLECQAEMAALIEASNKLAQSEAKLENLRKGRRPSEIASLEARLKQAQANVEFWNSEFQRKERLFAEKTISSAELDQAKAQRDAFQAEVESLRADLDTARLGARVDEIRAAEADMEAAKATVAKAQWAFDQKTQKSPVTGAVQDAIYRVGEFVPAGNPVVSLLPPENVKVRFFVPEPRLAEFKPGTRVAVVVDGTDKTWPATVNFVSTEAEFTPPVIYNRENRAKLVFMIEAKFAPEHARELRPGQPVDVRLATP
jgi:HlyD family secretion protein